MFRKLDVIIAGGGISGLTCARLLAEQGKKVLVVEKKRHIGGHCYDHVDEHGILVQTYGPHILHTNLKLVWDFLSRFTEWYPYQHEVGGVIDGQVVPIPFNLNSLEKVYPRQLAARLEEKLLTVFSLGSRVPILKLKESGDPDLKSLAEFVYDKVFLNYTLKQWGGRRPEDLDSSVLGRVPVVISRDDRYFHDIYQGIPLKGFSVMLEKMADHPNIQLLMNTDVVELVRISQDQIKLGGRVYRGDYIYTGSIDDLFDNCYGPLPYRSLDLKFENFSFDGYYQPRGVINYPNNYDYTRITEFKYFQRNAVKGHTTICREYPVEYVPGKSHPFYIYDHEESRGIYERYRIRSQSVPRLFCLGRLGEYRYYDIDKAVEAAMNIVPKL